MRKIIFLFITIMVFFGTPVLAAPDINVYTKKIANTAGYDNADQYTFSQTVGKYIKIALSLVGTIFLALVVYAGFLWMTASGNEEAVTKATDIIKMAVIGLAITLSAYAITFFIIARLGGASENNQSNIGAPAAPGANADCGWGCLFKNWSEGFNSQSNK